MGTEEVTDQPRDIHGTPLYVGDRVVIAFAKWCKTGPDAPVLAVRVVTYIGEASAQTTAVDDLGGAFARWETNSRFYRLP